MSRVVRDLFYGVAFGLGAMVARIFFFPSGVLLGMAGAWAGWWGWAHSTTYFVAMHHVGLVIEHAAGSALASGRATLASRSAGR